MQEAKAVALAASEFDLEGVDLSHIEDPIDERVEEAEHCWLFFQHRAINVPPERSLSAFAYAVAKDPALGAQCIADYRGNEPRLQEYLQTLSDFFGAGGAPARWPPRSP